MRVGVVVVIRIARLVVVRVMASLEGVDINILVIVQVKVKDFLLQFTAINAIEIVTKVATNVAHIV